MSFNFAQNLCARQPSSVLQNLVYIFCILILKIIITIRNPVKTRRIVFLNDATIVFRKRMKSITSEENTVEILSYIIIFLISRNERIVACVVQRYKTSAFYISKVFFLETLFEIVPCVSIIFFSQLRVKKEQVYTKVSHLLFPFCKNNDT